MTPGRDPDEFVSMFFVERCDQCQALKEENERLRLQLEQCQAQLAGMWHPRDYGQEQKCICGENPYLKCPIHP